MGLKTIKIIGASQRAYKLGSDIWEALYECNQCGAEIAYVDHSSECETEDKAREKSSLLFDKQIRHYCYICGYKLTDKEDIQESYYISILNERISKLESENNILKIDKKKQLEHIKEFQKTIYDLTKQISKNNDVMKNMNMSENYNFEDWPNRIIKHL